MERRRDMHVRRGVEILPNWVDLRWLELKFVTTPDGECLVHASDEKNMVGIDKREPYLGALVGNNCGRLRRYAVLRNGVCRCYENKTGLSNAEICYVFGELDCGMLPRAVRVRTLEAKESRFAANCQMIHILCLRLRWN